MDNSNIISASDILDQPPPPPPRHSSKITPPPLPPKSSCWIVNNSTSSTSGSNNNGTLNPHHSPHHKSHHHHHSSPSSSTQPEATKKDDLKAIQKRALLEFYLKHKKKQQHQHHSTSSLHQQTQLNHHQSKNQHSKSSSTSNIFHPTTNASSSKVELVVSNPSNGFTNTSESFNCLPSSAPRNHTGLTANMNHCSNSTSSSSSAIPSSLISSVNPPKHQHSGNGYVCGGSDSNRLSPTSKLSSSTIVTTTTTITTSSTSSASSLSSSASSSPPPLPPLPLKSHIGSLLLPAQPPPPPPSSAQITKNSTPTVINCESNMLVASKSSASPPIALKTVTLNNSQPPLPPNPMHLHHHHNKQKQIITNSQPLPVSSSPRSELLETDLTHLPTLLSEATSMDPLPSLPAPHLHSKTPSNASSNTLDSESCFTGPGSSGTLTSNCSSSSGIGSSSSSSSSSSDSSNNGHSGCNDPLLPNAITNDIIAHKTTSPSFPIDKTDTHLESLSSFPNYPPPPPPPLPPLPLASSSLPLPPPPCPSSSSSPLGSHSMTVRVSGSMLFESDDNFNIASRANFSGSSPITSYQRPVSIGAIESTTIISTTPSLPVRSYSSNNHNNHLDGHSHQNHSHHLNFNNSHHNHEPTRLSNNNSSSIGTPENSVSCNQGRFNKQDSVKSNGKLTSNSNCYNTVTASGSTSPPTTTSPSYLHNAFSDNTVSLCDFRQYHSNGMLNCRSSSPSSSEVKNRDEMNKLNGNSLCDLRPNGDGNNKLLNDSWSVCRIETPPSIGQYQSPPHPTTTSSSSFFPLQSVSFAKSNKRSIDSEVTKRGNEGDNHHHGMIIETSICSAISKGEPIDGGGTTGSGASSDGYSSGSLSPTSSPSSLDLLIDQPYVIGSTLCGQPILSNSVDAIPKLTEHLDCLRSEYSQMKSEILANETTGTGLLKKLTLLGITCQESEKISIHLEEIEKITRLLLSLSSRLKSIEADIRSKKHEPPPSTTLGGGTLVTNCTYTSAPSNNNNSINNSNGGCENLVSSSSFLSSASSCSSSLFFNRNLTSSSSSPSSGFHVTSIHNNNHHLLPSSASSSSSLLLSSNPSSFPVPGLASVLDNGIDNTCNNNNNSNPELESLLLKRNKLLGQLEEAIGLKQSIDRTSQTISDKIIVKYFKDSNEDVDSFVRFIQLKPKLILEEKQLIDKIEIRERQLLNLTNAT